MARYTGPKCKLCRREGIKLFLKGERCHGRKCALTRRGDSPPGMQAWRRGRKTSEYGMQLREKQRLKRMFGILEKQFRLTFGKARIARGNTGEALLNIVQRRLDNVIRVSGFGYGITSARQVVSHGLLRLNGRKVYTPSIVVNEGDVITVAPRDGVKKLISQSIETAKAYQELPEWLERDEGNLTLKVLRLPSREEFPLPIREQLVVEGLSK